MNIRLKSFKFPARFPVPKSRKGNLNCDVASGFNFKIGHFLCLNRLERKKVTLRHIIRFSIQWKRSGSLVSYDICRTFCIRERSVINKR